MRRKRSRYFPVLLAALALAVALARTRQARPHVPPRPRVDTRVLFIGNSYTFFNDGLDKALARLVPRVAAERVAAGGATLKVHWEHDEAHQAIRRGNWDYVVLQEQSQTPVINRQLFAEYAARFDQEIRHAGAHTVLLMTWERPDSVRYGVTTANLAAAYDAVGGALGAPVAPAGLAFAAARRAHPEQLLYQPDGHPTAPGTLLAACVVAETIGLRRDILGDGQLAAEQMAYFLGLADGARRANGMPARP